jgi:hypothetical protein
MMQLMPWQTKVSRWSAWILAAAAMLFCGPSARAQSSPLPARPGLATSPSSALRISGGTVSGSIFWDQGRVAYNPSVSCQSLQVQLDVITGAGLQKFATTSQFQFTQSPQVGHGLGLCSYSFSRVPEGVALQVQVSVGNPFGSRVAAKGPFGAIGGLIKIPGGQCNSSSTGTTLSSTYLESGWMGCGEHAYNVNFQLVPANTLANLPRQGTMLVQQAPGTNIPSRPMLLQPNPQPGGPAQISGMLMPAVRPAANAQPPAPTNGGFTGGISPGVTAMTKSRGGTGSNLNGGSAGAGSNGGSSGGSCMVTRLRLRIATADDDLRGGKDNLNIIVYFVGARAQAALNVNKSKNWPNGSTNYVDIALSHPVSPSQIRALRLIHVADGSLDWMTLLNAPGGPINPINIALALQSPDNWTMWRLDVEALGNGVGGRIAYHGKHRFTGSNPDLAVYAQVPANLCGSGRPTGNSNGGTGEPTGSGLNPRLNPGGGSGLHPVTRNSGAGSSYGMQRFVPLTVTRATTNSSRQLQNNKLIAPIRVSPGTPVQQPNAGSGSLMNPGGQQTMLATQAGSLTSDSGKPLQGTVNGTNSPAQSAGSISPRGVSPRAALQRTQVKLDPAAYTAQSCAKDPSFRIVAIRENSSGVVSYVPSYFDTDVNLPSAERTSIVTPGHLFTVFGCSFGNGPTPLKGTIGMSTPGHTQTSVAAVSGGLPTGAAVYAMGGNTVSCCYYTWEFVVRSWSDNAIVITAPVKQDTPLTIQMIGVQTAAHYNTYAILWR